jgi:predicted O-methyltransferase YrrM|tara:strand:+ start:72800 stop:73477 length:678 start_codon:yes stop_codon:yes gene_type:complete
LALAVSDPRWSAVDDYIAGKLIGEDAALAAALADNRRAGLPAIDVSPAQGKLLQLLAKGVGARRILEIGTLGGYSTIWLARALEPDGRLVTLELDPAYAAVARMNIDQAGVGDLVEIRIGPACDTLADLCGGDDASFDFIFVDADKENYAAYLGYAIRLSRPGTMLVFDNVVREGEVMNPQSDDPKVPGTRQLYDALQDNRRIDATAIQTVGSKKWDGFLLALVQ